MGAVGNGSRYIIENQDNQRQLAMLRDVLSEIQRPGERPCLHVHCSKLAQGFPGPPLCDSCFEALRPRFREGHTEDWLKDECVACMQTLDSQIDAAHDHIRTEQE